jgi:cobalt-precorrin-5B (C1)-methyltransferase
MKKMLRHASSTPLRTGYTTGACAAAAAKGVAQMLALQEIVNEVTINLPAGVAATFQLHGQSFTAHGASCFVIKDAGDDPDVTHGAEVWATANPALPTFFEGGSKIKITGGTGIGKVTKPGLALPPGEWAINPVPRQMIEESVRSVFSSLISHPSSIQIVISIPDGEQRAEKTLNQRLGIIGGLSILGTTGIVRPISAKAWTDTIDAALDVARACGCNTVVLSTGRTSEMAAQKFFNLQPSTFNLSEEAFIMMGDHVAYAVRACSLRGFAQPIIACQFAKLLKIACGHENTHAAASVLDLATLKGWAEAAGLSSGIVNIIAAANTAREIAIATGFDMKLIELVTLRAGQAVIAHTPGIDVRLMICGYDGNVVWSRQ